MESGTLHVGKRVGRGCLQEGTQWKHEGEAREIHENREREREIAWSITGASEVLPTQSYAVL